MYIWYLVAKWACEVTVILTKKRLLQYYQRPSYKWYKLPPCMAHTALGLEFGSAARLSKMPGSVWNCLWGHALKRSPGINRKSRVSYPGPGFLSSATCRKTTIMD